VIVPLAFTVCFMLLQQLFEYPDILRQPTGEVLAKFAAGGTPLVTVWYVLTLTAVAFVPLTLLVHRVLAERETPTLVWIAVVVGKGEAAVKKQLSRMLLSLKEQYDEV
jgi:hypothetical protein